MLNQKLFVQIWGPRLEKAGYIRKGSGYYFLMPAEQIIKLVHMEILGPYWFRIDVNIACYADDINMDDFKHSVGFDLSNNIFPLFKKDPRGCLAQPAPEQKLEEEYQMFEEFILPLMEGVRSVEDCYHFRQHLYELTGSVLEVDESLFECIQCGWYDEALKHAQVEYEYARWDFKRSRYYYEVAKNLPEQMYLYRKETMEKYEMWLNDLQAGVYDRLHEELQRRIDRSRKSCSKYFGWRM